MDALVYEDSPLAAYFEGEAHSFDLPREPTPPPHTPFAPHGLPDLKKRLHKIRRSATSIAPGSAYTEELLERLRYVIIASGLLSDETGPRPALLDQGDKEGDFTTLRGAAATAIASFCIAWTIHWYRTRQEISARALTWSETGSYIAGFILLATLILFLCRRQYSNYVQRASVRTVTRFANDSHGLDATTTNVLRFIQEVEIVARGYELGSPLPPITRIEDRHTVRRCTALRRELAATLRQLTVAMVHCHHNIQPFVSTANVQRYHDIYEISLVEYTQAIGLANNPTEELQDSLKELRFAIRLHSLSRKVFLCDLLALRQTSGWARPLQWSRTLSILRELETETHAKCKILSNLATEQEWGSHKRRRSRTGSAQDEGEIIQDDVTIKTQLRLLENVAQSARALNAKVHLAREEVNSLTSARSDDANISSTILRHYESLGTEIRDVLYEWERGKSAMMLHLDTDHERTSVASSSVRTPLSATSPIGSPQIMDGGPADALRLLNGDSLSLAPKDKLQEEVFEAVASRLPRNRMSVGGMTREEKIAKLAEERKKRQTLQEQADTTTNMLRELQMVIKHRPKGSLPSPSTVHTSTSSNRVASL